LIYCIFNIQNNLVFGVNYLHLAHVEFDFSIVIEANTIVFEFSFGKKKSKFKNGFEL